MVFYRILTNMVLSVIFYIVVELEPKYLISIYFKETGPYTLEQLVKLARERKFTWGHYVNKLGDNKWFPASEIEDIKKLLEHKFAFVSGDTGPAGGLVFIFNNGTEELILEAAPHHIGPVPACDAQKICADYKGGGHEGWRLPDEDELRAFTIAHFSQHISSKHETTVLFWSFSKSTGKACAVVTKEDCDTWNPWEHKDDDFSKYKLGDIVKPDEATQLHVLPVRELRNIKRTAPAVQAG
jgi:hypothetical protein